MRRWSDVEDEVMRTAYGCVPAKRIARALDRSVDAVQSRAVAMGITHRRDWTESDDETLAELFGSMGARDIASRMGRTAHAVNRRIRDLRQRGDERFPYKRRLR